MLGALESINIRTGTPEDQDLISNFAMTLSEDPHTSKEKWLKVIKQENVYPLIAEINGAILGKIQARIFNKIGWIESARVTPNYRKLGIANTLMDEAMKWLHSKNVTSIRSVADSDNLSARIILEKNGFKGHYLAINPSVQVVEEDANPENISLFTNVVDPEQFDKFNSIARRGFHGNVMIDGKYIPFDEALFNQLINEKRILANHKKTALIITSAYNLPEEYHAFGIAESEFDYNRIGKAVRAYAAQELSGFAICHAPSKRMAVQGLVNAGYGWNQPHTLIIYQLEA